MNHIVPDTAKAFSRYASSCTLHPLFMKFARLMCDERCVPEKCLVSMCEHLHMYCRMSDCVEPVLSGVLCSELIDVLLKKQVTVPILDDNSQRWNLVVTHQRHYFSQRQTKPDTVIELAPFNFINNTVYAVPNVSLCVIEDKLTFSSKFEHDATVAQLLQSSAYALQDVCQARYQGCSNILGRVCFGMIMAKEGIELYGTSFNMDCLLVKIDYCPLFSCKWSNHNMCAKAIFIMQSLFDDIVSTAFYHRQLQSLRPIVNEGSQVFLKYKPLSWKLSDQDVMPRVIPVRAAMIGYHDVRDIELYRPLIRRDGDDAGDAWNPMTNIHLYGSRPDHITQAQTTFIISDDVYHVFDYWCPVHSIGLNPSDMMYCSDGKCIREMLNDAIRCDQSYRRRHQEMIEILELFQFGKLDVAPNYVLPIELPREITIVCHKKALPNGSHVPSSLSAALTICRCLQKMHDNGYIHGDIAYGNILYDGDNGCLIDFDTCGKVGSRYPKNYNGSAQYRHPEIREGSGSGSLMQQYHDVYSLAYCLGMPLSDVDKYRTVSELMTDLNKSIDWITSPRVGEIIYHFNNKTIPTQENRTPAKVCQC